MITNDAELALTREQLRRAESILDSTRRDFLPHNEVQYRLFSGSTIDLIQSIRADIDAYLGIAPDTDLVVSLEGEGVALGTVSAGVITRTIDAFRHGLQSVASLLHAEREPQPVREQAGWIARLCDLSLAGVGPGSVRVYLDLSACTSEEFGEADLQLLSDAVAALFDGLEWAAREDDEFPPALERLDQTTRLSVLGVLARLLPPQTGPVERIAYFRRWEGPAKARRATLTRQSQRRAQREMERLAGDRKFTEAEGMIRQIDLDAQTFILRERHEGQADLPCEYPTALADTVKELLGRWVKVYGLLETSRLTHRPRLEAEILEPLACGGEKETVGQAENAIGAA